MSDVLTDAQPEAPLPAASISRPATVIPLPAVPIARPATVIPFPVDRRRAAEAEARRRHPSARTV